MRKNRLNPRIPLLLAFALSWVFFDAGAQVFTEPLRINPVQYDRHVFDDVALARREYLRNTTSSDTIGLDFFDDFSGKDLSWAPSRNYFGQAIRSIQFTNDKNARAFGGLGLNLKTTSRGSVWENIGQDPGIGFNATSFPETNRIWACGQNGWLAKSTNNGETWQLIASPSQTISLLSIGFHTFDQGVVADSAGSVFSTTDGGLTWTKAIFSDTGFKARSVQWVGASRVVAVGMNAKTAVSANAGLTFTVTPHAVGNRKHFRKVRILEGGIGFAVGDSGLIYKTANGGLDWISTLNSGNATLRDVGINAINSRLVWVVGDSGALFYSQTEGWDWSKLRSGLTDDLLSIALVNEFRGWIGTSNGRLLQVVYDPLRPISKWWAPNSGVFINNTFTLNPLTVGVATFDGLNQHGLPYSLEERKEGGCDTLTSTHFSLGVFGTPPLYLSFYYQPGTTLPQLIPDLTDSLVLQFQSPRGRWLSVWNAKGIEDTNLNAPFRYVSYTIPDSLKYDGARFRFINYGNQNGNFDIWNLDYVRLDGERDATDSLARDYAVSKPFSRLMKDYSALPMEQFRYVLQNAPDLFNETVKGEAVNLNPFATNLVGFFYLNRITADTLESLARFPNDQISGLQNPFLSGISKNEIGYPVAGFKSFFKTDQYATFQYGIGLSRDPTNNQYQLNDTVLRNFNASTVMAYDDGTAELVRGVGGNNTIGVVKFYLPVSDTLTDIQLVFGRTPQNLQQSINFFLMVYDSINVATNYPPDNTPPLIRRLVILPPSDSLNKFINFNLRDLVPLSRRLLQGGRHFYVGWQQGAIDNGNEVRIGCDINSANKGSFLFRSLQEWKVWEFDDFPLLLRPVFGPEVLTSVRNPVQAPKFPFYPNPTKNTLQNQSDFSNLLIYNTMGQRVFEKERGEAGQTLQIDLPKGIYSLKWMEKSGRWVAQRLVVD